jgi:uncharacterized protein (DUF433 family)
MRQKSDLLKGKQGYYLLARGLFRLVVKTAGLPRGQVTSNIVYSSAARRCLMLNFDRITIEPGKMNGQPCIRGMRITVRRVVLAVATYGMGEDFRRAYPGLEEADVRQALEYAAANLDDRVEDLATAR